LFRELDPILSETLVILGDKLTNVTVDVNLGDISTVTARRSQLGQVFTNLISNACDAVESKMEQGKDYHVKVLARTEMRQEIAGICLEVHDNGPGIPMEIREQILHPFFTTKEVGKGTGLGMPIINRIIESHGGELLVGDSNILSGACVGFWIPNVQSHES
jgi:C4-dicarboxylate-specific signal transduction histidine kinase